MNTAENLTTNEHFSQLVILWTSFASQPSETAFYQSGPYKQVFALPWFAMVYHGFGKMNCFFFPLLP